MQCHQPRQHPHLARKRTRGQLIVGQSKVLEGLQLANFWRDSRQGVVVQIATVPCIRAGELRPADLAAGLRLGGSGSTKARRNIKPVTRDLWRTSSRNEYIYIARTHAKSRIQMQTRPQLQVQHAARAARARGRQQCQQLHE